MTEEVQQSEAKEIKVKVLVTREPEVFDITVVDTDYVKETLERIETKIDGIMCAQIELLKEHGLDVPVKLAEAEKGLVAASHVVTVQRIGEELFVPLPEAIVNYFGLKAGDTFAVSLVEGEILLTPERWRNE